MPPLLDFVRSENLTAFLLITATAIPFGAALQQGIAAAREPLHRVVPGRTAWFFFWRIVRRRTRAWRYAWAGLALCLLYGPLLMLGLSASNDAIMGGVRMSVLDSGAFTIAWAVLLSLSYVALAPRTSGNWSLALSATSLAIIAYLLIGTLASASLPWSLMHAQFTLQWPFKHPLTGETLTARSLQTWPIGNMAIMKIALLLLVMAIALGVSRRDAWLRLKE